MKFKIDLSQPSTIRGAILVLTALATTIAPKLGMSSEDVVKLGIGLAGLFGITISDNEVK
jgi:acyl carrier protein